MKETKYNCGGTRIVVGTSTLHFMVVPTISTPSGQLIMNLYCGSIFLGLLHVYSMACSDYSTRTIKEKLHLHQFTVTSDVCVSGGAKC